MTESRMTALHARHLAGPVIGIFARPIFAVVVGVYPDLPTSRACQGAIAAMLEAEPPDAHPSRTAVWDESGGAE